MPKSPRKQDVCPSLREAAPTDTLSRTHYLFLLDALVKALLEELDIEFWSLESTTFDQEKMDAGVEPDDCFYIQNEAALRGKDCRWVDLNCLHADIVLILTGQILVIVS